MKLFDSPWTIAAILVALMAAAIALGVSGHWEAAVVSAIGSVAAILLALHPHITETPMADPALSAEESAGRARVNVVEALSDPIIIIRRGRVIIANDAALALLGRHIMGEDVRVAIRHPAAAEHLSIAGPITEDPGIALVGLGRRDTHWLLKIADIGDDRRLVHLVDRSETHAAEKMRVDFVANASHELRTPLAGILGFIETLQDAEAGGDPATRDRFLGVMMNEAKRMQSLVDDLISLSRIEADKYRAPDDAVDIGSLAAETSRMIQDRQDCGERALILSIEDDLPRVAGDRVQLSQVLHNVVGNAIKYGRPGTPVRISLKTSGHAMVQLKIEDEGEGVAPHHIARLTERFYRVDSGRSRSLGGTGLGLSIVKHIVERHRGKLDIASVAGRGTTVTITLPISSTRVS